MRILASLLLTFALAGCAQPQEPAVTEMPSAQVDAPQSEATADPMEAEGGETNEGNESAEPTNEATEEPTSEPKEEQSAEPSPSPTPTKTTEPAPTKTAEPSPSPTPTKTTEPAPTKTAEPSPSPTKTQAGYTLAQVAQKNSQSACWVAIDGMVYDLTDWIRQHPGGRGAILSLCGTDGTSSFNAQHGGRAGPSAALDRYVLGPLTN